MAIYVKKMVNGNSSAGDDFKLYADDKSELTGSTLTTSNYGAITCQPGSVAYTLAGESLIISSSGVWTLVEYAEDWGSIS